MSTPDKPVARQLLRSLPAGLAALACAACCLIPMALASGLIGGAGWVLLGHVMPGIAVVLATAAAGLWWWRSRRRSG